MSESLFYEDYTDEIVYPACSFEKNNDNIPHFHSAIELMYIIKGSLHTTVNGKHLILNEGDLLIVPSSEIHMFKSETQVEDIVLLIPINYIPAFEKLFSTKTFCKYVLNGNDAYEIYGFIQNIAKYKNNITSPIVRGYTYLILGYITEKIKMKDKQIIDSRSIQSIVKFIDNNYTDTLTIKILAKKFRYTENRLSRLFNQMMGCSFPDYIGKLRSKKAAYLLTYENYSVIDASMEAGFESLRTFHRVFKQNYNTTPLQYKKSFSSNLKNNIQ